MSNIRLQTTNTDSARRTIKLNKFRPVIAMNDEVKASEIKQSSASKSLEKRRDFFRSKEA